MAQNLMTAIF